MLTNYIQLVVVTRVVLLMWPLLKSQKAKPLLEIELLIENLRYVCQLFAITSMHQLLVLRLAYDTEPTAGMTEGAGVGNETNCLHFL